MGMSVALMLVPACTSAPSSDRRASSALPSPGETPAGAIAERALRQDLRTLVRHIRSVHPDRWHDITREDFDAAVSALDERLGDLGRDAFMVEAMRLMALLGVRDGHSGIFPTEQTGHLLPLHLYRFDDGVFVVDATEDHADLVGTEVTRIAGGEIDEVWSAVEPLVPRDNDGSRLARVPQYLVVPEVLHGLGLTQDPSAPIRVTLATDDGGTREVDVEPIAASTYATEFDLWNPLIPPALPARPGAPSFEHADEFRWVGRLDDAVYVGYHVTIGETEDLAARIRRAVGNGAQRVVLDLRFNPGGDNGTYAPLLDALQDPVVDRAGRLLVLIGRSTFSAAGNLATELDVSTSAVFVGERGGFAPNQFGDPSTVTLPNTGIRANVATVFWRFDGTGSERLWIEPDVTVPIRSADYLGGRDLALETALSSRAGSA